MLHNAARNRMVYVIETSGQVNITPVSPKTWALDLFGGNGSSGGEGPHMDLSIPKANDKILVIDRKLHSVVVLYMCICFVLEDIPFIRLPQILNRENIPHESLSLDKAAGKQKKAEKEPGRSICGWAIHF